MEQAILGRAVERTWLISSQDLGFEFMMNALRLVDGVSIDLFQQRTGININKLDAAIQKAQKKGLLIIEKNIIKPTLLGQRFLNELLELFLI